MWKKPQKTSLVTTLLIGTIRRFHLILQLNSCGLKYSRWYFLIRGVWCFPWLFQRSRQGLFHRNVYWNDWYFKFWRNFDPWNAFHWSKVRLCSLVCTIAHTCTNSAFFYWISEPISRILCAWSWFEPFLTVSYDMLSWRLSRGVFVEIWYDLLCRSK